MPTRVKKAKRRTPHETAKVSDIRDALRRNPDTDKTRLAKELDIHKATVFRVVREIEAGVPPPTNRCASCGRRLFTQACLACQVTTQHPKNS